MTQQEFADYIKIAPATLSSIFTGRTRPTLSVVEAVKNRFPNISTDWLMFGAGPMLKEGVAGSSSETVDTGLDSASGSAAAVQACGEADADGATDAYDKTIDGSEKSAVSSTTAGKNGSLIEVKKCDIRQRRISEIRIFYDDQTWETFVPQR